MSSSIPSVANGRLFQRDEICNPKLELLGAGIRMRSQSNIPPRKPYNPTPLGPEYTDEERRKKRELTPHGVYPGTYRRRQTPTKTSYFVSTICLPDDNSPERVIPEYAELLIASIPLEYSPEQIKEYWEHSLLAAYYHLYGDKWSHWAAIIPWLTPALVAARAESYGCEMLWDWSAKKRFLSLNDFKWSLPDLNRLIDRYPDYQRDNDSEGMYIPGRTFEEIQQVALALNLPTIKTLGLLAEYALGLKKTQR